MNPFTAFRDVEASLWQSALDTVAARQAAGLTPYSEAAAELPLRAPASPLTPLGVAAGELITRLKQTATTPAGIAAGLAAVVASPAARHTAEAVALARAFPIGARQFLSALTVRFGHQDPLWLETAYYYFTYLTSERLHGRVPYTPPKGPDDFVLTNLPDPARVALFADWGTGTAPAYELIQRVLARKPDVLIHLGDIYYSGREPEIQARFLDPLERARKELGVPPLPTYSLCGNHDMYCGGVPYYRLLEQLGQPASCFCLRNDHWQLIALDTGHNSGLLPPDMTWLQDPEVAWLRGLVDAAGSRKTVLLSHHQLFSAFEAIGTEEGGVNHRLYEQVKPVLDRVARWFWGHEHSLVVYEPFAPEAGGPAVTARCIGHGAIPVAEAERPKRRPKVAMQTADVQLGLAGGFFNHGYAILELNGPTARASYFQSTPGGEESWPAETF
jgi:hypothetical protein